MCSVTCAHKLDDVHLSVCKDVFHHVGTTPERPCRRFLGLACACDCNAGRLSQETARPHVLTFWRVPQATFLLECWQVLDVPLCLSALVHCFSSA